MTATQIAEPAWLPPKLLDQPHSLAKSLLLVLHVSWLAYCIKSPWVLVWWHICCKVFTILDPSNQIYEHFACPSLCQHYWILVLELPLVKPRFLQAIGLVFNACLTIPRVNMNGSKECLPALSTTVPSEKKINGICPASFFHAIFCWTSGMLSQNWFHHNIYIYLREVYRKEFPDLWKLKISSILAKLTEYATQKGMDSPIGGRVQCS